MDSFPFGWVPPGDPARRSFLAQALAAQGATHAAEGRPGDAEKVYRRALALVESAERIESTILEDIRRRYAALLISLGRDAEAATVETRTRETRRHGTRPAPPA